MLTLIKTEREKEIQLGVSWPYTLEQGDCVMT